MRILKTMIIDAFSSITGYPNAHQITSNIWLGNYLSSNDTTYDLVINATPDLQFYNPYSLNIRVPVNDDLSYDSNVNIVLYILKYLPIIHRYVKNNKKILIHCYAGMQRSASIVAAYLMIYENYTLDNAISYIRSKRNIAFRPGVNFRQALEYIENNKDSIRKKIK